MHTILKLIGKGFALVSQAFDNNTFYSIIKPNEYTAVYYHASTESGKQNTIEMQEKSGIS